MMSPATCSVSLIQLYVEVFNSALRVTLSLPAKPIRAHCISESTITASSRLGPITAEERRRLVTVSPVSGQYDKTVDRESAYELLKKRASESAIAEQKQAEAEAAEKAARQAEKQGGGGVLDSVLGTGGRSRGRETVAEAAMKSVARSVSSSLGRAIVRGILGSLMR